MGRAGPECHNPSSGRCILTTPLSNASPALMLPRLNIARSVPVFSAAATTTAGTATAAGTAALAGGCAAGAIAPGGRGEQRKLLGKPSRTAARAFGSLPFAGTNQDLAVVLALEAMKLVNRHGARVVVRSFKFKVQRRSKPFKTGPTRPRAGQSTHSLPSPACSLCGLNKRLYLCVILPPGCHLDAARDIPPHTAARAAPLRLRSRQ